MKAPYRLATRIAFAALFGAVVMATVVAPHAEAVNDRQFKIIGEVVRPGSYAYVPQMTVLNAVGFGGGFTRRARMSRVYLTRANDPKSSERLVPTDTLVQPGDVVRVTERFF